MPNDPLDRGWKVSEALVEKFVLALGTEPVLAPHLVHVLGTMLGESTAYASRERRLRFVVEESLKAGFPVVADRNGYRLATDAEELRDYAEKLQASAEGLMRKSELVMRVCEKWFHAA